MLWWLSKLVVSSIPCPSNKRVIRDGQKVVQSLDGTSSALGGMEPHAAAGEGGTGANRTYEQTPIELTLLVRYLQRQQTP